MLNAIHCTYTIQIFALDDSKFSATMPTDEELDVVGWHTNKSSNVGSQIPNTLQWAMITICSIISLAKCFDVGAIGCIVWAMMRGDDAFACDSCWGLLCQLTA